MDLRTRTSLFCGLLVLTIVASVLLRGRMRRPQVFFALFATDMGLWYLTQWRYHFHHAPVWMRFTAVLAILMPLLALHLFEAIVPPRGERSLLPRLAALATVPMVLLALSPYYMVGVVRGVISLYVFSFLAAGLWSLLRRGERSGSRATQRNVRFLVLTGAVAAVLSQADFLWFIGAPLPPVGAVLSIPFLFVLAESLIRDRWVDHYEILGMAVVSTALAFTLAGIFYLFVELVGGFQTMYLNAILASIIILTLFEPLRDQVTAYINRAFRERKDLENAVARVRRDLAHVLQADEMMRVVVAGIEDGRAATAAAVYLRDPMGSDFELGAFFGRSPPRRIDGAAARPLTRRLETQGAVVFEELARDAREARALGESRQSEADAVLLATAALLGPLQEGVCLGIRVAGEELFGLLILLDDRVRDAFSASELVTLGSLASQMGVVVENSRQYQRMQERARLAALGQMAAGLAHEVKNPLGAIKGAAQLLGDPDDGRELDAHTREFLSIIVEEVDRLDRVVRSVLDYGRPAKGNPLAVDVNSVVRRTIQVLSTDREQRARFLTELEEPLPRVRVDEEQLRQVLMNLLQNAVEAQGGDGQVLVQTRARRGGLAAGYVEIAVVDRGPGIAAQVQSQLFEPFFTTKARGTGLGLAISQRVVQEMGGRILVASEPGQGATFTVVLPIAAEAEVVCPPAGTSLPPGGPPLEAVPGAVES